MKILKLLLNIKNKFKIKINLKLSGLQLMMLNKLNKQREFLGTKVQSQDFNKNNLLTLDQENIILTKKKRKKINLQPFYLKL